MSRRFADKVVVGGNAGANKRGPIERYAPEFRQRCGARA